MASDQHVDEKNVEVVVGSEVSGVIRSFVNLRTLDGLE